MGHGLCESFNKQTALTNVQGQATSDSKDIGDHAWRLLKSWGFDPGELRGIGIHIQKLENSQNGNVGQATLPFQAVDRKPLSKGLAPPGSELPELVVQPPSSQGEVVDADAPEQKYADQVSLPSLSQVDMEVLEALPDDIRKELEDAYRRRSHSPMVVETAPVPVASPPSKVTAAVATKGSNVKRITQQLAPKSGSTLSPKKSMLFAKRDTPASASAVRVSDAQLRELDIDPDVFAALPVDMQREQLIMARNTKKGGIVSERRLVIKDTTRAPREKPVYPKIPLPKAHRPRPPTLKQQGKQRGEKLSFTETDDIQRVIEAWVEGFEEYPPNQKDVDFFCKFLVQSVEFSDVGMEKTVAVMRWWLVLLRRRWGVHEADQSEVNQSTQRVTSEVVGKAWWKAFREVKDRVDVAARKRFGGSLALT